MFAEKKFAKLLTLVGRISQPCTRAAIYETCKAYVADGFNRDVAMAKAMTDRGYGFAIRLATNEGWCA